MENQTPVVRPYQNILDSAEKYEVLRIKNDKYDTFFFKINLSSTHFNRCVVAPGDSPKTIGIHLVESTWPNDLLQYDFVNIFAVFKAD